MRDTTVIISELELDGETAIKIANCIKKHEPEIWKGLSKALKQALPIPDVVGRSEQLVCDCVKCKPFHNESAGYRKHKFCVKNKAN